MLKKRSIIREWGISYAVILLVPLITIFINYGYNVKIIRKEIMQAHELILDNLKSNIDLLMDEEREIFSKIYLNEKFQNLFYTHATDADFRFNVFKFNQEMALYGASDKNVAYWIYLEDKEFIIKSGGAERSINIYNAQRFMQSDMPDYEEWKEFLCGDYINEFLIYNGLYSASVDPNLVYANSFYDNDAGKINVFITISTMQLEELVASLPESSILTIYLDGEMNSSESRFLAIDSEGMTELPDNISMDDVRENKGTFEVAEYMGISTSSDNGRAIYSLLIPQETFWKESSYIRNIHFVSLLIAVFVGACLIVGLVKRNFKPVSGILEVLGNNNEEINEFDHIRDACNIMRQENIAMKKTIEVQEESMVSSYLLSLLKGRVTKVGKNEKQLGLDLLFQKGAFALIGFYIPRKKEESIENDELSFFVVDNIFSELMEKESFYRIEDGRFIFYLFCISNQHEEEWKEKSLKHANFLCDILEEKFGLLLSGVISEVTKDIAQAKNLYQSVMECFEYRKIIGGSGVILAEELKDSEENNLTGAYRLMLEQALENGKEDEICLILERLFGNIDHMPFIALRLRVLEAFQIVSDSYNKYISDSVKQMQLLSQLEQLLNADNPEALKQQFNGILTFACSKISGQWEAESRNIVKMIKEYVESNYTDSNLNISTIAEKMHRNPKYISKVFKEETGEGILDYINLLRIRKAQEILLTRSVSVETVSEMVGYASTRTFRRCFAKVVGVTPSGYLENK